MKTYKSRISIVLLVNIAIICFCPLLIPTNSFNVRLFAILVSIFLLILVCLFSIKYVIDGQTLHIYYFWGIHQNIDIKTIQKMEPSRCLWSSPAASLNRLAIYYGKSRVVYISPRNQEDFVKTIDEIRKSQEVNQ